MNATDDMECMNEKPSAPAPITTFKTIDEAVRVPTTVPMD